MIVMNMADKNGADLVAGNAAGAEVVVEVGNGVDEDVGAVVTKRQS